MIDHAFCHLKRVTCPAKPEHAHVDVCMIGTKAGQQVFKPYPWPSGIGQAER